MIFGAVFTTLVFSVLLVISSFFHIPYLFDAVDSIPEKFFLVSVAVLFSLWPDVDTNSVGQDIFYSLFFIIDGVLIFLKFFEIAAYFGLFTLIPVLGKHRGWTHTKIAVVLIPLPIVVIPCFMLNEIVFVGVPYYLAAVFGYMSHLLMDGILFKKSKKKKKR